MIGHSIGEYVAACVAGVLSLEDALALVAARGRLMQQLPGGAMLAVPLPEEVVRRAVAGTALPVAAVNSPTSCVVAGPAEAVSEYERRLENEGISSRRLRTSHAFHSTMMEPVLEPFVSQLKSVKLNPPRVPFISNLTGTWITATQATDPHYWADHLRHTVRFADGAAELLKEEKLTLLEVGPGRTLCSLVRQQSDAAKGRRALSSVRPASERQSDRAVILDAVGQLWLAGVKIDWPALHEGQSRRRMPLPTYPFERKRYWIDPVPSGGRRETDKTEGRSEPLEQAAPATEHHPGRETPDEIRQPIPDLFETSSGQAAFAAPTPANGRPLPDAPPESSRTEAALEQVVAWQLQIMARQLEVLGEDHPEDGRLTASEEISASPFVSAEY